MSEPAATPYDIAIPVSPLVRRVVADNPGHMTGPGTNTWLVGHDEVAVIDPGPEDERHTRAIVEAGDGRIRWILCTHTHPDHSPGAAALVEATGATVLAWSNRGGLRVDRRIGDGFVLETEEWTLEAVHTPGHAGNHLCFLLRDEGLLFSGDHIMQGSTVVISPPDGDMGAYLASLAKVRELAPRAIAPGHGTVIEDPIGLIDWYVSHRLEREAQLRGLLEQAGSARIADLVEAAYVDLDPVLIPMAKRSVHAHLRKLAAEGAVSGTGARGVWSVVGD